MTWTLADDLRLSVVMGLRAGLPRLSKPRTHELGDERASPLGCFFSSPWTVHELFDGIKVCGDKPLSTDPLNYMNEGATVLEVDSASIQCRVLGVVRRSVVVDRAASRYGMNVVRCHCFALPRLLGRDD
jgi:hypothetical protein